MSISLWLPIDQPADVLVPSFENIKDSLLASISVLDRQEDDNDDDDNGYNQTENVPFNLILKATHKSWIEAMSFSHNVASSGNEAHTGEFSITKYISEISPLLCYSTLRAEVFSRAVCRARIVLKKNILSIVEYELIGCRLTNQSVSGGSGGKPVETLSLACEKLVYKNFDINIDSGEYVNHYVATWDTISNKGSRTIIDHKPNPAGVDVSKQAIINDNDEKGIKELKESGLFHEYEMKKEYSHQYYVVLFSKEPLLYKRFTIPGGKPTRESIIQGIATRLSRDPKDIQGLYSEHHNFEIETDQDILDQANHFFIKIDDQYLGK